MKKYTMEFTVDDNGLINAKGENEGFTAIELLGLINWKRHDIEQQIFGDIRPDIVSRKVIED